MPGALLAGILLLVLSKIPNFLTRISNREIFLNSIFVFRHPRNCAVGFVAGISAFHHPRPDWRDVGKRLDGGGRGGETGRSWQRIPAAAADQSVDRGGRGIRDLRSLPRAAGFPENPEAVVFLPRSGTTDGASPASRVAFLESGTNSGDERELRHGDGVHIDDGEECVVCALQFFPLQKRTDVVARMERVS